MSAYDFYLHLGARGLHLFLEEHQLRVAPDISLRDGERLLIWQHGAALVALIALRELAAATAHPDCAAAFRPSRALIEAHARAQRLCGERLTFDGRRVREDRNQKAA